MEIEMKIESVIPPSLIEEVFATMECRDPDDDNIIIVDPKFEMSPANDHLKLFLTRNPKEIPDVESIIKDVANAFIPQLFPKNHPHFSKTIPQAGEIYFPDVVVNDYLDPKYTVDDLYPVIIKIDNRVDPSHLPQNPSTAYKCELCNLKEFRHDADHSQYCLKHRVLHSISLRSFSEEYGLNFEMIEVVKTQDRYILYLWRNSHEPVFSYDLVELFLYEKEIFFDLIRRLLLKKYLNEKFLYKKPEYYYPAYFSETLIEYILSLI